MSKKLLFNFNREAIQNYTYVKYVGTVITATNTLEKPIKSAILKGSTKYRDIDTGEVLDAFEDGRNLELVSVRMPVLTTTGKNLFDGDNSMEFGAWNTAGGSVSTTSEIRCKNNYTPFPKGLKNGDKMYIVLSDTSINSNTNMHIYGEDKKNVSTLNPITGSNFNNGIATITINDASLCCYFSFRAISTNTDCKFAIMVNEVSQYEPFKSNILTVNEDVTLRSNGSVYDELDLLTGKLTQRIDENGGVLSQEIVKTVDLSILDQNENKVNSISSFNDTTHIMASSETVPPTFEGYLATKEVE